MKHIRTPSEASAQARRTAAGGSGSRMASNWAATSPEPGLVVYCSDTSKSPVGVSSTKGESLWMPPPEQEGFPHQETAAVTQSKAA